MVPIDWHNYIRSKESTTHQTRLNPFWITTTLLPPTTPKPHTMKYQIVAILLVAVVAIAFAGPIGNTNPLASNQSSMMLIKCLQL